MKFLIYCMKDIRSLNFGHTMTLANILIHIVPFVINTLPKDLSGSSLYLIFFMVVIVVFILVEPHIANRWIGEENTSYMHI